MNIAERVLRPFSRDVYSTAGHVNENVSHNVSQVRCKCYHLQLHCRLQPELLVRGALEQPRDLEMATLFPGANIYAHTPYDVSSYRMSWIIVVPDVSSS